MTKVSLAVFSGLLTGLLAVPAHAEWIHAGNGARYSYQIAPGSTMIFNDAFQRSTFDGAAFPETLIFDSFRSYNTSLTIEYRADPGLIIDDVSLGGVGGFFNNFRESGGHSRIDWQFLNGTYSGLIGANSGPYTYYGRNWGITGSQTGFMSYEAFAWYSYGGYDFNNPLIIAGHYDIGAAQFTLNLTMEAYSHRGGFFDPTALALGMTFADAPLVVEGVPAPGALALLGLGLLGFGATRRKLN